MYDRIKPGVLPVVIFCLSMVLPMFPGVTGTGAQQEPGHDALEYEVKVNVQMAPMFAVDKDGRPVYDLKQEDLELWVNGKPFEILYFNGFKIETAEESRVLRERRLPGKRLRAPDRLNFIIIDSLISNLNTLGPSRVIASRIIQKAPPGDAFVILESNQLDGFHYLAGPEKNKQKLVQAMADIETRYMTRRMYQKPLRNMADTTQGHNAAAIEEMMTLQFMAVKKERNERSKYQKDLLFFSKSLKQLKFALRSTPLPKTVFLISAGHVTGGMGRNPVTYLRFLEEAAKEVSRGGALFYLINPLMQGDSQKGAQLKFMADAAGGKMISGKSIKEVVTQVKQSTAAYYEIAFSPKTVSKKKYRIDVRCKRKGVALTTISHSEKERPYHRMKKTERKLFILNVVNRGFWSRTLARVKRVKYKMPVLAASGKKNNTRSIEVPIPMDMRKKTVHIYKLEVDAETSRAQLKLSKKQAAEKINLTIKLKTGKRHYFVIIEPTKALCIYNKVI
jgi:VWFA-related protein